MASMLEYRRRKGSGTMVMMDRKGGFKSRKKSRRTFEPGDTILVGRKEDLPGFPHAIDGWELVGPVEVEEEAVVEFKPKDKKSLQGVSQALPEANLKAVQQRGNQWKVVVEVPGLNYTSEDGVVLPIGTKVHSGFVSQIRAELWAATGEDPGESVE